MFRRASAQVFKIVAGVGSVQLGAAAINAAAPLTDKQLSKKPDWYQKAVLSLEDTLKKLSKYGFIENEETLNAAEDTLQRVVDMNHPEVLWRLARTYAEQAEILCSPDNKAKALHQAIELAEKAISLEGSKGIAGAHKWYAIALERLIKVDKQAKKDAANLHEKAWAHLKRATELDGKDPYAWHLLGLSHYHKKEYKEAIIAFQKAESVKPGFSAANLYHLGEAQRLTGQKSEAIETLKKALTLHKKNKFDIRAKSDAKRVLLVNLKQKEEEIKFEHDI